jgi:hypothetical protein
MSQLQFLSTLKSAPLADRAEMVRRFKETPPSHAEIGAAFRHTMQHDGTLAVKLAEAYAEGLTSVRDHRAFFQHLAASSVEERQAGIQGYRNVGLGSAVVHAVGFLPAAQGRAVMRDFLIRPGGEKDRHAFSDLAQWLSRAGEAIRKGEQEVPPPVPGTDAAVVEWIEGAVDTLVGAIKSVAEAVIDAVGDVVTAIANAVRDIVEWTVEQGPIWCVRSSAPAAPLPNWWKEHGTPACRS